jgi:protein KIAA0825
LTATIGASALIKNSLYVYIQNVTKTVSPPKGDEKGGSLKVNISF